MADNGDRVSDNVSDFEDSGDEEVSMGLILGEPFLTMIPILILAI